MVDFWVAMSAVFVVGIVAYAVVRGGTAMVRELFDV